MSKRTLLAFFLSLLVIWGYNYYLAKKYPSEKKGAPEQQVEVTPVPSASSLSVAEQPSPLPTPVPENAKDILVETDLLSLVITSSGARIKSCQLKQYPEERITVQSVQTQLEQIEQARVRASDETKEALLREERKLKILLEKISRKPQAAELVSLAASVDADFSPRLVWPDNLETTTALNTNLYRSSQDFLILNKEHPEGRLELTYVDARGRSVKKTFSFSNSSYAIGLDVELPRWPEEDLLIYYGPDIGLPLAQQGRRMQAYQGPITYFQTDQQDWVQKEKYGQKEANNFVRRQHQGRVLWTGLENKYFLSALIPEEPGTGVVIEKNQFGEQSIGLEVPARSSGRYSLQLYLGPKKEKYLKAINVSLDKSIDYGFFGPIARFIYQTLVFFSRWTNNFGWAIVLLCIATKIVLFPLTHHSFEAMQRMQQQMKTLQPEMEALREKFRDSPQKLNKATMELYRKKGINPLASCQSGCLPLFLQMPVFFALYAVLYNSIELRGEPFLGWVNDLSAKDPYYILPILMGISMFVQQKFTGMGTTGGAQQDQAKMMAYFFPIFLTWIFASLPSGVVLYWLTFNIVTALQQVLIKKRQAAVPV